MIFIWKFSSIIVNIKIVMNTTIPLDCSGNCKGIAKRVGKPVKAFDEIRRKINNTTIDNKYTAFPGIWWHNPLFNWKRDNCRCFVQDTGLTPDQMSFFCAFNLFLNLQITMYLNSVSPAGKCRCGRRPSIQSQGLVGVLEKNLCRQGIPLHRPTPYRSVTLRPKSRYFTAYG